MSYPICDCGHHHDNHQPLTTYSPNFSSGPCTAKECKCKYFNNHISIAVGTDNQGKRRYLYLPVDVEVTQLLCETDLGIVDQTASC